ncbi:nuclear transport factor 2 family protein [Paucibacter sp. AS339]|uniref:nuclear transport factor 2 family protein n=1 Tax=Paucibacter hankyongi TaxID=3133434 RepID=UPI00309F45F4
MNSSASQWSDDDATLLQHLTALECQLHQPAMRTDADVLAQLLHPQFREFGRSGRSYTRESMLALLMAEDTTDPTLVHAQDFELQRLGDEAALLTYRSAHRQPDGRLSGPTHRSSVWRKTPKGWQMIFHQGTPTSDFWPSR